MAIALRSDFDAHKVRLAARQAKDGPQARRLLALAAIYDGATRTQAAEIGGVTLQIIRDWVIKFNAFGPAGLIDRKAPGHPSRLNDSHRAALEAIVESGPDPVVYGLVRWRLGDLCQWIRDTFQITLSQTTMSRELHALGYRKLSARPRHHAQAKGAIEDFKKTSPPSWTKLRAKKTPIQLNWKSGFKTKPASAKKTKSHGVGPNAAQGLMRHTISAPPQPTFSVRSVPSMARERDWLSHIATRKP